MTRHQTVMHLHPTQNFDHFRKYTTEVVGEETDEPLTPPEAHYVTLQNFEDMGCPETITTVVYPGDALNDPTHEYYEGD